MSEEVQPMLEQSAETYCYGHPKTATRLRCSRCDRPICGRCAIPASVGQHCPECVAEARRGAPRVRSAIRATAPAVMMIIALNIVVYVAQLASPTVTARFASFPPAIQLGESYRLITAMFLHSPNSVLHILFNMYVLYQMGPTVEQTFGTARFVTMYIIAGFGGSALSYSFGSCAVPSVGASGAIFGVVGILIVYLYNRRGSAVAGVYLRSLMLFLGLNLAIGFAVPAIDELAHLGGLAAGAALGWGFDRAGGSKAVSSGRAQLLTGAGVVALGVALVAWRTATFPPFCNPFG